MRTPFKLIIINYLILISCIITIYFIKINLPHEYKDGVIEECVRNNMRLVYCSCVTDYLYDNYSEKYILSLNDKYDTTKEVQPEFITATNYCLNKLK